MKKMLIILCAMAATVTACHKNATESPSLMPTEISTKKVPIRVDLSRFVSEITNMGSRRNGSAHAKDINLADKVSHLYFAVMKEKSSGDNELVRLTHYTPEIAGGSFGTITDTLTVGQYFVYVIAAKDSLQFYSHADLIGHVRMESASQVATISDIFSSNTQVYISGNDTAVWINPNLTRNIANIQVKITDFTEVNASNSDVIVNVKNVSNHITWSNNWFSNGSNTGNYYSSLEKLNDSTYSGNVLGLTNGSDGYTVEVLTVNRNTGDTIHIKNIPQIRISGAQRLILSGKALVTPVEPRTSFSFDVSLVENWSDITPQEF